MLRFSVSRASPAISHKIMANMQAAGDWDFRGVDTKSLTHCFHPYPAMMIPQIAGRLINAYGCSARVLLDPYCGTGTSLVEANVRGIRAKGSDLNPLARLIATAKTAKLPLKKLKQCVQEISNNLVLSSFGQMSHKSPPVFDNINFWFPKDVQYKLAVIKFYIDRIGEAEIRRFFLVAFSETVRECSYTRNSEFKLYRMPEQQRKTFNPDVFTLFSLKLERNFAGFQKFMEAAKPGGRTRVFDFNSVVEIPPAAVPPESVDLVVTSPPYGDSSTTVAYGQFSRLTNEWLGYGNAAAVDRNLMGGKRLCEVVSLGDAKLDAAITQIAKQHPKRAREVCAFYRDYRNSIGNVAVTVKRGGYVCYVVGNRKVQGVVLPTDRATESYFAENGFMREHVFIRNIPNKSMPSRNSPSNIPGVTDATICNEHIVVMRKHE